MALTYTTGLVVHFDASEITGHSDNDPVSQWDDESGNGNHLTQGTGTKQPLYRAAVMGRNALPAVEFDGSDDRLTVTFGSAESQPNTIFIVFEALHDPVPASREVFLDSPSSGRHFAAINSSGNIEQWANNFHRVRYYPGNNGYMLGLTYDGFSSEIRDAGRLASDGNAGTGSWSGIVLGSHSSDSEHANIRVAEVIGYDHALSTTDRETVEQYLEDKYHLDDHGGRSPSDASQFDSDVATDAPVGYWKLDETSGTTATDDEGTNDGGYEGNFTLDEAGPFPGTRATEFSGESNAGVRVPNDASLESFDALTIELWARSDNPDKSGALWVAKHATGPYFLGPGSGGLEEGALIRFMTDGDSTSRQDFDYRWRADRFSRFYGTRWYHIAATWDGSTKRVYINGEEVTSESFADTALRTGADLWFGTYSGSDFGFAGRLSRVAVYDSALSSARIEAHYLNATSDGGAPTLSSATTNAAGTEIEATFTADMADPTGEHGAFTYKVNGGSAQSISAAALKSGDDTTIVLTLDGTTPSNGDTVTLSYDDATGSVQSAAGEDLASFTDEAVTNAVPAPATLDWSAPGAVTATTAAVVAKLDSAGDVEIEVDTDDAFGSPTTFGPESAASGDGFAVRVALTGLTADTQYHYRVVIDEGSPESDTGSFRTAPTAGTAKTFNVATSGDASTESEHAVFGEIEAETADLFIHLGDLHYENISTDSLSSFRTAYDDSLGFGAQNDAYRVRAFDYVWDDHDYGADNSDSGSASKPAAQEAYRERVPHYTLPGTSGDTGPIYHAYTWGRVRFIVTDLRSERSANSATDDGSKTMLGSTQKAWFKTELTDARDAGLAIVWVSSVPWPGTATSSSPLNDGWAGFSTEREELGDFFQDENLLDRMVILSADWHALAIDDGTNTNFAGTPSGNGPPVFHAAALDRGSTTTPFTASEGHRANSSGEGHYALLKVVDTGGSTLAITYEGYRVTSGGSKSLWNDLEVTLRALPLDQHGPSETIEADTWRSSIDGSTDLHVPLADDDNANWAESGADPDSETSISGFDPLADPGVDTGHKLTYRYSKSDTDGRDIDLTVRIAAGDTVITSQTHSAITSTITEGSIELTESEVQQFRNLLGYSDLRVEMTANRAGSGSSRRARVYYLEFELPELVTDGAVLILADVSSAQIQIDINGYDAGATQHDMYRATSSMSGDPETNGTLISEDLDPSVRFTDSSIDPGETYFYQLVSRGL